MAGDYKRRSLQTLVTLSIRENDNIDDRYTRYIFSNTDMRKARGNAHGFEIGRVTLLEECFDKYKFNII